MTEHDKALDKASKHSALAVLGMSAATAVALFGPPFFFPLVAIPMVVLGALQRLTERPWLAAAACVWGAAVATLWGSALVGTGAAVVAVFAGRHWVVLRKARQARQA